MWLWHRGLAGHCWEVKPPYSQHRRQTLLQIHQAATVPGGKALCSHPLEKLSYWAQRTETSTVMSIISAAGDLPVLGGHRRHLSERSWVRSMGAWIRHIFLDYWDVLGRIQGETVTAPDCFSGKKKKSLIKSRKLRSHSCTHREGSLGCSIYYWWNQSEDLRSAHQQSTTRTRIRGAYWWGLLPTRCQMASEKPGKPWIFLLT